MSLDNHRMSFEGNQEQFQMIRENDYLWDQEIKVFTADKGDTPSLFWMSRGIYGKTLCASYYYSYQDTAKLISAAV